MKARTWPEGESLLAELFNFLKMSLFVFVESGKRQNSVEKQIDFCVREPAARNHVLHLEAVHQLAAGPAPVGHKAHRREPTTRKSATASAKPGANVMIFKTFSPKKMAVLTQSTAIFLGEKIIVNLPDITENNNHL
jgi:hypothetical protein